MPGKTDKAPVSRYSGPAFYDSPSASSLPIPKFFKRLRSGSDVRLTPGTRDSRLDAVTHIQQALPNSAVFNTKSDLVSVTSETKSPDAKTATSATKEQDKPIGMEGGNSPGRCNTLSSIQHVQNPETTLTASVQGRVLSPEHDKQLREAKEKLETEKLIRHQQAIIDRIEAQTTYTAPQSAPQARAETQTQEAAVPVNSQRAAQHYWIDQLRQATLRRAYNANELYRQSTEHLLQVLTQRLERNLAKQQQIIQQEMNLTSSSSEDSKSSTEKDNAARVLAWLDSCR